MKADSPSLVELIRIAEAMGEAGQHARFAVGAACLPLGASVEVEAIFELA